MESAIFSTSSGFGEIEVYPTVEEKAARIALGIVNNHAFLDAHVIIRTRLEKPSKINGLHYFSPCFLRLQDKYYHFISRFYLKSRTYIIGQ